MKYVIVGGKEEADFVIKMLKQNKKNKLVVINKDRKICKFLAEANNIRVLNSDHSKGYTFEEAEVSGFDFLISLCHSDTENYVVCKMAKDIYGIKKVISIVNNPKNVDVFKRLGIERALSSTYLLTQAIKSETNLSDVFKTSTLQDDKVLLTEVIIKENSKLCNKTLMEIRFPEGMTVSCIYRSPDVIIPKGNTEILTGDKLLIISSPNMQKEVIKFVEGTVDAK